MHPDCELDHRLDHYAFLFLATFSMLGLDLGSHILVVYGVTAGNLSRISIIDAATLCVAVKLEPMPAKVCYVVLATAISFDSNTCNWSPFNVFLHAGYYYYFGFL